MTQDEILALIAWHKAMGADAAIGFEPINWLERPAAGPGVAFEWPPRPDSDEVDAADQGRGKRTADLPSVGSGASLPGAVSRASPRPEGRPPSAPSATPRADGVRPQTPLAPSAAETEARRAARSATTLEALEAALRAFDGCALKATAKNLCFYRGAPKARLVLIGEAPGREEDLEGKPFVGRAGQLLDKMLSSIGLDESKVHITNIVYWRPPGNRTPTPQEAVACRPFLERQLELVEPSCVVVMGGAAAKEILGEPEGIMKLRGKWRQIGIGGGRVPVMATLHPAYLLRTPAAKQLVWADLLAIKSKLSEIG